MLGKRAVWHFGAALVAIASAIRVLGPEPAAHDRTTQVTWTTDVEPILKSRCLGCHTAGGFAPLPLDTYEAAKAAATAIRDEVLERRMPPWPAARGFGEFANARTLTALEVELLTAWANGATPLGPPIEAVVEAAAPTAKRSPDLVVRVPSAHDVSGPVQRFVIQTGLAEARWIDAWEFQPGNRALVEQAVLSIEPAMPLGAWTPPETMIALPDGVTLRLPPRARIVLDVRYRKSPTPQTDQSAVALYFARQPGRALRQRSLACGTTVLDESVDAVAITPRLGAAGESVEIVATRPDRTVEPLCVIPRYEPGYPITYRFRRGVPLPRGSSIEVRSSSSDCSVDLSFVGRGARPARAGGQ
jgi:hypothetical protein